VVKLSGRLVKPGAPGLAAIDGNDGALIAAEQYDAWFLGIDPDTLVIVAPGCAAPAVPGFAAIGRFPADDAGRINYGAIFRIES
jgi:hypothetical protein